MGVANMLDEFTNSVYDLFVCAGGGEDLVVCNYGHPKFRGDSCELDLTLQAELRRTCEEADECCSGSLPVELFWDSVRQCGHLIDESLVEEIVATHGLERSIDGDEPRINYMDFINILHDGAIRARAERQSLSGGGVEDGSHDVREYVRTVPSFASVQS